MQRPPAAETRLDEAEEDGEADAAEVERDMEAWERAYADDRSWESLKEDASGLLLPVDVAAAQREKRRRYLEAPAERIRRGMIRYVYILLDLSRAASETDFRPSRMAVGISGVEAFIREFFDQNPLSHLGLILLRDGVATRVTELGGNPESHIRRLRENRTCSGDASIQNALEVALESLDAIPAYGHREVLLLYSALGTCDPGDILGTVQKCQVARVRCSVVGLAAELYICRQLCEKTGGGYSVAMNETHFRELLLEHAPPPPSLAESAAASLVRMGFPQRGPQGAAVLCACHLELKMGGVYTCPRCRSRVCELPTECAVCGLTLVSSPHLARSYHHLFPVPPFEEVAVVPPPGGGSRSVQPMECFGCGTHLPTLADGSQGGVRLQCLQCRRQFCFDCDVYVHESLHNCPGCECAPTRKTPP